MVLIIPIEVKIELNSKGQLEKPEGGLNESWIMRDDLFEKATINEMDAGNVLMFNSWNRQTGLVFDLMVFPAIFNF